MPLLGPMWFLFGLFWAALIYSWLKTKFGNVEVMIVTISLWVLSCWSSSYVRLPFSLQAGFSSILYLHIGNKIYQQNLLSHVQELSVAVKGLMLLIWLLTLLVGHVSLSVSSFGFGALSFVGSVFACVFILYGLKALVEKSSNLKFFFGGGYYWPSHIDNSLCSSTIAIPIPVLGKSVYKSAFWLDDKLYDRGDYGNFNGTFNCKIVRIYTGL